MNKRWSFFDVGWYKVLLKWNFSSWTIKLEWARGNWQRLKFKKFFKCVYFSKKFLTSPSVCTIPSPHAKRKRPPSSMSGSSAFSWSSASPGRAFVRNSAPKKWPRVNRGRLSLMSLTRMEIWMELLTAASDDGHFGSLQGQSSATTRNWQEAVNSRSSAKKYSLVLPTFASRWNYLAKSVEDLVNFYILQLHGLWWTFWFINL